MVMWVLGFVGGGGRTSGIGYGLFNADLTLLFDSKQLSRVWPDWPASYTHEGLGFVGTPLLFLVTVMAVVAAVRLIRDDRGDRGGTPLWPLWAAVGLMFVYATLPVVRLGRHELIDLTAVTDLLGPLTGITRSSGRFAWPLLWLAGLTALGAAARLAPRAAVAVMCSVAVLQLADSRPPPRIEVADRGAEAEAAIADARADGVAHVEFQPPFVATDCTDGWSDFADVAALAIAAGAVGMTVNAGYPSRGSDRYAELICTDQPVAFAAGEYRHDVLYALPTDLPPQDPALACHPAPALDLILCRAP